MDLIRLCVALLCWKMMDMVASLYQKSFNSIMAINIWMKLLAGD